MGVFRASEILTAVLRRGSAPRSMSPMVLAGIPLICSKPTKVKWCSFRISLTLFLSKLGSLHLHLMVKVPKNKLFYVFPEFFK